MKLLMGPWRAWPVSDRPTSITVGVLDGVHRGHRSLLAELDQSDLTTVLTFEPHPLEVLRPDLAPPLITTLEERAALLGGAGVELVGALDLGEIRDQGPEEFVTEILVGKMRAEHLVVGGDFRFGKDRSGDVATLEGLGDDNGFRVDVVELVADGDGVVSSSRIRELISKGQIAPANELLGSRFQLTSEVVHGDKRGREIGFPTANMRPPGRKLVPGHGVYACFAVLDGVRHQAAVNVGVRPTFGGGELLVEAYILDFDDEIYGNELTVEFVQYLRPELSFDTVDALVRQMETDVEEARSSLVLAASRI